MRIALIHIGQETNDFNPIPTTLRDYESFGIVEGTAILDTFKGLGEIGGFVDVVERSGRDIEKIVLSRAIWNHLQDKIIVHHGRTIVFH